MKGPALASNVIELHAAGTQVGALSFEAVYKNHFRQVHRWATRLAPSLDPEDVCQDVFVVVNQKLGEFAGRARITTWLFQITYRTIGAQLRRERNKRTMLALLRWLQPNMPPEPLDSALRAEEIIAVRQALEALPLKHRSVLVLFELESWSCADIAEALRVPLDTVYSRLHHARQKLAHKVALALGGQR